MRLRAGTIIITTTVLMLLAGCLGSTTVRSAPPETAEQRLIAAKAQIMAADYGADLAGLSRLRDEVLPLAADPAWGYLAHYWAGFASWRLAINGASNGMSPQDMRSNLEEAVADFEASIRLRGDFADSYAAAAGVNSWLPAFLSGDSAAVQACLERYKQLLARAKELEPDNPRVLWVEAAPYLFLPAGRGGDVARAVELYRRMIEVSGPPVASSPLPDWGKPEGLMSLAFAHWRVAPDLEAAEQEARAALRLQPDWSYVKNILLPQIVKAREAGRTTSPGR